MRHSPLRVRVCAICVTLACVTCAALAQERDRARIPDKYKWNLADIYPSDAAWRAAKDALDREATKVTQHKGRLLSSATTLANALESQTAIDRVRGRLSQYANL